MSELLSSVVRAGIGAFARFVGPLPPKIKIPLKRHRLPIDSLTIYYQIAGSGQPVVLVHGLSGSTRWWVHNIQPLARHFQVHIIDLIGFGRSARQQRFVLDEAAECLVRWMDRLGIERAHFIGHSMGGYIAAELAADHPERVERLVLVDAAGLPFGGTVLHRAVGLVQTLPYVPFGFLPVLATDALRAGPLTLLRAGQEILQSDLSVKLARIQAPTLVIWGAHDEFVPLRLGRRFRDYIRDLRFVVIPGAGHNPMWDRPAEFNRLVTDFLSDSQKEAGEQARERRRRSMGPSKR